MAVDFETWFMGCNGEIRVQPARYGGGWIAVGCILEEDWDEKWSDLIGGDNDYFDARDYFERGVNFVYLDNQLDASTAFLYCLKGLQNMHSRVPGELPDYVR